MKIAKLKGKWRIYEMAMWDKNYLDMLEPAYIEFQSKGTGSFHFGCIYAQIDYRVTNDHETEKVEFTFYGDDEGNEVFGRGWVKPQSHVLEGYLCFHGGDESPFKATRMMPTKSKVKKR